ncbi:hypothetical protein J437_LFUL014289 [Ladona fulva]|uniref:Uncharacterized protein n=1 Tax=Ladona fulva TaxID=123851 RepID=A0A8K0KPY6_LADFU|nr:hypothetical protein J437_LFUL014289 [Ladona fulva]
MNHERLGITKEVMATKVLPFLLPLLVENGLSLPQFNALAALINDMVKRVETEHRVKITQLSSIQQEQTKKNAKRAVARAKAKAIEEANEEIEKKNSERQMLRITKARDRASKDITSIRQMKDTSGVVLREDDKIRRRWKEYFHKLLNEENPRGHHEDGEASQGVVRVNCLVCIGRLLEHLDKWLVLDEVLPFLPEIPSREPAVLMGILALSLEKFVLCLSELISAFQMALNAANPDDLVPVSKSQSDLDSIFSGLGIEDSLKSKNETPDVPSRSTSSTFDVSGNSANSTASPSPQLSIEDKMRLSKQKMHMNQMQSVEIKPQVSKAATSKDMEKSLLERNLNEMSKTSTVQSPLRPLPPPNLNSSTPKAIVWSNLDSPAASSIWSKENTSNMQGFPKVAETINPITPSAVKNVQPSYATNLNFMSPPGQGINDPLLMNSKGPTMANSGWNVTTPLLPYNPQLKPLSGVKSLSPAEINDLLS